MCVCVWVCAYFTRLLLVELDLLIEVVAQITARNVVKQQVEVLSVLKREVHADYQPEVKEGCY